MCGNDFYRLVPKEVYGPLVHKLVRGSMLINYNDEEVKKEYIFEV